MIEQKKFATNGGKTPTDCFSARRVLLLMTMRETFYVWLIEAVGGLILIGFGLSLFGQSVIHKSRGESVRKWFWWGTTSLIVVNSGICIFGDAVKTRIRYEDEQKIIYRRDFES